MAVKKRGLGRGLDALLSSSREDLDSNETPVAAGAEAGDEQSSLRELPLESIEPGRYQPRRDMSPEALEELSASIKAQGVMQPIVVRPIGEERYEIIAGERRWRAAKLAEMTEIPAVVRDVPDDAAIAMALIENIQREDLNPMEEAMALHRLQTEFELTQQQVAEAVGKSRSTVTNLLRLMKLSDEVKRMLEYGDLEMGHARALLALEGEDQLDAAKQVISKALSVRETEQLVKKLTQPDTPKATPAKPDERLTSLSTQLSERFSVPVQIKANAAGKGRITLNFKSQEELEQLLSRLG